MGWGYGAGNSTGEEGRASSSKLSQAFLPVVFVDMFD